jgi:methionine-rich copper-binding protein CopC
MIQLSANRFIWMLLPVVVSAVPPLHSALSATMRPVWPTALVSSNDESFNDAHRVHLRLTKSEPAQNDTLTVAPSAIRLWFSQRAELRTMRVTVRAAAGDTVAVGALTRGAGSEAPVVAPIVAPMTNGSYTVDWRTMASDGHVVRGSFEFVVRGTP